MVGYILRAEECAGMGADDLREELAKLARYTEELEEENTRQACDIAELEEERDDLRQKLDARDDGEERAADAVANACEKFTKYQAEAGGGWYSRDLREFIEGLADAMGWLACADIDADRIANTAPLF